MTYLAVPQFVPKIADNITYDESGFITRIDYDNGTYRLITYNGDDTVNQISLYNASGEYMKTYEAMYFGGTFNGWNIP